MNAYACAPDDVCLQLGQFKFDFKKHQRNVKKLQIRIVKVQHFKLLNWLKCENDEA